MRIVPSAPGSRSVLRVCVPQTGVRIVPPSAEFVRVRDNIDLANRGIVPSAPGSCAVLSRSIFALGVSRDLGLSAGTVRGRPRSGTVASDQRGDLRPGRSTLPRPAGILRLTREGARQARRG